VTLVRATFRKQASDGNYGSEAAELTLEVDLETPGTLVDPGDVAADYGEGLLAMCRRRVFDELRQSPSAAVRRALEYPKAEPVDDRAYEWAQSNAMAEEQAIRADDDERMPF
jgi:hypothetical protein